MRFFAVVFTLVIVVCTCQRRCQIFCSDVLVVKGEDGGKEGRVTAYEAVKSDEKYPFHDKFYTVRGKPVGKSRIIYPTEDGETVRGPVERGNDDTTKENTKIPESLLIAMNNVHSVDEFLRLFVARKHGDALYNNNTAPGLWEVRRRPGTLSRKGLSGGEKEAPQVAAFAGCQPQKSVVRVNSSEGNGLLLWPPCVYVKRCGGCCTSELMTCRPTATSTVNVTVLQARYTGPQSSPFANEGVRVIALEQHDRCACGCKELPEDCTDLQEYRKNECRCVCANQDEATRCLQGNANKFWDSHDCICKCRSSRECSSGLLFSLRTCRCEVLRFSLSSRVAKLGLDRNGTETAENENYNSSNSMENK